MHRCSAARRKSLVDRQNVPALLSNDAQNVLQRAGTMTDEKRECDNLIARRLKERIHIILVFVVGTTAELCLGDRLVDRPNFATVNHFLCENRLFNRFRQNLLTYEIDPRHINFHELFLRWIESSL